MRIRPVAVLLATLASVACQEDLLAPGNGSCPTYCPAEQLAVVDSVLLDNVTSDSTVRGYVVPFEATAMQAYRDSTDAGDVGSRLLLQTIAFSDSLLTDSTRGPVVGTDSFALEVSIVGRNSAAPGLELGVFRLPVGLDSTVAHDALAPYFADSTLMGVLPIPDSLVTGTVRLVLDSAAFPGFVADGNRAAIGLALRNPSGYVTVGTLEGAAGAILTRYARADSAGVAVPRMEGKLPEFDGFTAPPAAPLDDATRAAGGAPAARTLLRFALPARIMDSSTVIRATLVLLPLDPVSGAPGDSLTLIAQGVAADVGAKSPLLGVPSDSVARRVTHLAVGTTDTVRLDVTDLVILWTTDSTRPRAVSVRAVPEGDAVRELRFGGRTSGLLRPRLMVTFVPPLTLGGR
jgi:hypothetical protein